MTIQSSHFATLRIICHFLPFGQLASSVCLQIYQKIGSIVEVDMTYVIRYRYTTKKSCTFVKAGVLPHMKKQLPETETKLGFKSIIKKCMSNLVTCRHCMKICMVVWVNYFYSLPTFLGVWRFTYVTYVTTCDIGLNHLQNVTSSHIFCVRSFLSKQIFYENILVFSFE